MIPDIYSCQGEDTMKNYHKLTAAVTVLAIGFVLLSSNPAMAKGTFAKLVISGGHLTGDIEVTDPALLGFMSLSDFSRAKTQEPDSVGDGYIVTRFEQDSTGVFIAWDKLRYYPSSNGSGGYIFYEGLINGVSEYDEQWYMASPEADATMRQILVTSTSNLPAPAQLILPFMGFAMLMMIAILGLAIIKKRSSNQRLQHRSL
jgi:hypothetical protein